MAIDLIKTTEDQPLVTVFVCCYNHARFAEECLESIRRQTYLNLQVIVMDDCSADGSVALIEAWLAKYQLNWVFIKHQKNRGVCATLNEALKLAQGKYISMVATDDVWLPNKTRSQVVCMESEPESTGVLYSDAFQMDENGQSLPKMFIEAHRPMAEMPQGSIFNTLMEGNFIPAMSTLIRHRCFQVAGHYDEELVFEDWDMWLRMARYFNFKYFTTPSVRYRIVGTSLSRTQRGPMQTSTERMFIKCLRHGWLVGPQKQHACQIEKSYALKGYREKSSSHRRDVLWVFRHQPSLRNTLLLLSVCFSVPYEKFDQVWLFCSRVKRKIGLGRIA